MRILLVVLVLASAGLLAVDLEPSAARLGIGCSDARARGVEAGEVVTTDG